MNPHAVPRRSPIRPLVVMLVAAITGLGVATPAGAAPSRPALTPAAASSTVPTEHTVSVPVSCVGTTPGTPISGVEDWATELEVRATYPDQVPFGGSFDLTGFEATFAYGGPMDAISVTSGLHVQQLDRDGVGFVPGPAGESPAAPELELAQIPFHIEARGDVGDEMVVVPTRLDLGVRVDLGPPSGVVTLNAECTPVAPAPALVTVVIDPPPGGAIAGDAVGIRVTRGDGSVAYAAAGMLLTGDVDLTDAGGWISDAGGVGWFPGPSGTPVFLLFVSSVGRGPNGVPLTIWPTTQLLLVDPASGLVVTVPFVAGEPTNGLVMISETESGRPTMAIMAARGAIYPSGEPVTVTWIVRNLLRP